MNRSFLVPTVLIAAVFAPIIVSLPSASNVAMAQSGILAELYGSGVHAYYSHDYPRAYDLLTRAIDGGLNDPRAYYFRGLTNIATGRPDEAQADFQIGAELEAEGNFGPTIGRSLTRVQGTQRMQIERFRQQARLQAETEATERAQRRYSDGQQAEGQVRRTQPRPRTPPPIPRRRPLASPGLPADEPTPFDDDAMTGREPTVQSRDALEDALVDPFADDDAAAPEAPQAAEPAADDPFGEAAPGDDPFGAPPADDDDPFGAPPADEDDPFGGDPFGS